MITPCVKLAAHEPTFSTTDTTGARLAYIRETLGSNSDQVRPTKNKIICKQAG